MKKVIALTNQKGGVGKTTTAISLADFLSRQSAKKVLLVDLDPQGNATSGLGVDKSAIAFSSYNAVMGADYDGKSLVSISPNLDLLPANSTLSGAEVELVAEDKREFKLCHFIESSDHEYIVIDCPPSLNLLSVNALTAANYVIVPVQAEYYALEGVAQLLHTIQRIRESLNPNLKLLGIVATMLNSRTSLSNQVVEELNNHFGNFMFKTTIPRNVRLAEAPSYGKAIGVYDKWSKGARAYKQLAREVRDRIEGKQ